MFARIVFILAVVPAVLVPQLAGADIVATIEGGVFAQDSGVQSLTFLVESLDADSLIGFTADFQLSGGIFDDPPGLFGQAGMVGATNLTGFSFFERDAVDLSIASLSLDFTDAQPIPSTAAAIATLHFNVNGLAPGVYQIKLLDISANGGLVAAWGTDGTFEIVPEPSSVVLLALAAGCMGCVLLRRRRGA